MIKHALLLTFLQAPASPLCPSSLPYCCSTCFPPPFIRPFPSPSPFALAFIVPNHHHSHFLHPPFSHSSSSSHSLTQMPASPHPWSPLPPPFPSSPQPNGPLLPPPLPSITSSPLAVFFPPSSERTSPPPPNASLPPSPLPCLNRAAPPSGAIGIQCLYRFSCLMICVTLVSPDLASQEGRAGGRVGAGKEARWSVCAMADVILCDRRLRGRSAHPILFLNVFHFFCDFCSMSYSLIFLSPHSSPSHHFFLSILFTYFLLFVVILFSLYSLFHKPASRVAIITCVCLSNSTFSFRKINCCLS